MSLMEGRCAGSCPARPRVGGQSVSLPTITIPPVAPGASELEVHITSLMVREGTLALGASNEPGETVLAPPSPHSQDLMIRMTRAVPERLLNEAWDSTPHVAEVRRRFDVPDPRSLLDVFKGAMDVLLARGLRRDRIRVDRSGWRRTPSCNIAAPA